MQFLTTQEAGEKLGIGDSRVRQYILQGRLRAYKHGRVWVIEVEDLPKLKRRKYERDEKSNGTP